VTAQAAIDRLAALATGLCQDARIGVELHPNRWAWDPVRKVILVAADELARHGADYCAGVIAHEVGHFYISRYAQLGLLKPGDRTTATLLNAIEDPRVNLWVRKRYPGTDPWLRFVARQDLAGAGRGPMPAIHRFGMECVLEEARGWKAAAPRDAVPEVVADALAQTHDARRWYAEWTPPGSLESRRDDIERRAEYLHKVVPRLSSATATRLPTVREQVVRLYAAEALERAERDILPVALSLLDADREQLARSLAAERARTTRARQALSQRDRAAVGELVTQAMQGQWSAPADAVRARRPLADQLLDEWLRAQSRPPLLLVPGQAPAGGQGQSVVVRPATAPQEVSPAPSGTVTGIRFPPMPQLAYATALDRVARQIDDLAGRLDAALTPRKRLRARAGYASGQRLHLRSVMASEADPKRGHQIWSRRTIPDRREAVFSLLVDLSGSMYGDKAANALLGTVLLAETLHRLRIRFEINGFQDYLIPLCDFSDALNAKARQAISELPQEVQGDRPGGHNRPAHNDDGPCLLEAAERLLAESATDRLLVVVSDGQPAGARSGDNELVSAVAQLRTEPLHLVGIGLGPDTGHVQRFYDDATANVPVAEFATRIGQLLENVLTP